MSPKKKRKQYRQERRPQKEQVRQRSGWVHVESGMSGRCSGMMCFGVDLNDYPWESTGRTATVKDPLHGEFHTFPVYTVTVNGRKHEFAFGEYCMCIFGLYARY